MSDRSARMVVLCEDSQQHTFLYRLLTSLGFPRNRIRIENVRNARGAGDQFVRNRYPDEVAIYRRKSARMNIGLVTAIDADTEPVRRRYQELNEALEANGQENRQNGEEICILIPKREIETWIYALFGDTVNENTKYRPDRCTLLHYTGHISCLSSRAILLLARGRRALRSDPTSSSPRDCDREENWKTGCQNNSPLPTPHPLLVHLAQHQHRPAADRAKVLSANAERRGVGFVYVDRKLSLQL